MAAKKSYYNNLFSECKCSLHKTWNLIKSLIGHKTGSTDNTCSFFDDNDRLLTSCEVANKFNQHFSSIGKRITDNIPASTNDSFHSFLNQPQLQSMYFLPTIRNLGNLMDEHLTWSKHITHIQNLIAKNNGIISRIFPFINTKTALLLHFALIYPYLTYVTLYGLLLIILI